MVHGGTPPGLARPGSRVSDRIRWGVPIWPSTTSRCASAKSGENRRLNPTCSATPAAWAAVDATVDVVDSQPHRLLAEHCLARGRGRHDQVYVRLGRGGDDDGLDVGIGEELTGVGDRSAAEVGGERVQRHPDGGQPP